MGGWENTFSLPGLLVVRPVIVAAAFWRIRGPTHKQRLRLAVRATSTQPTQLKKIVLREPVLADEKPEIGDLVRIHYVGRLADGTLFDSSRSRGKPFEFNIGESEVIDGWDILIRSMALGEKSKLYIPPDYAYGEVGAPPIIPPSSHLVYEVELLDIGRPIVDDEKEGAGGKDGEEKDMDEIMEETLLDEYGKLYWEENPDREQGFGPGYRWKATGSGEEICIEVPLPPEIVLRDIKVDIRAFSLFCKIGRKTIIDGKVWGNVDMDESHWDVERRGRNQAVLIITLAKLDRKEKWKTLLEEAQEVQDAVMEAEVVDVEAALRYANAKKDS